MAPELLFQARHGRSPLNLRRILSYAVKLGASDVHLKVSRPPVLRVDGACRFAGETPITQENMLGFLDELMTETEKLRFLETGDADLAMNMDDVGRFRVNVLKQRGTIAIIMRHVKGKIPNFRGLNLPADAVQKIADFRRGLILVTGTTGSGKSTTLAAIIDIINRSRPDHIVSLEDPIEFVHEDIMSTITQREVGIDTRDFKTALRALMREDPDVILIGEMRDVETFEAAIHASETGHLVFSTVHTTNVMLTIDRIIDLFPPAQHQQVRAQLSHQLRAIMCQRLVPAADGSGRIPAVEIMFNNPGISALIRDNNIKQIPGALVSGREDHMQTFNMSLVALTKQGLITEQDASAASDNQEEFKMNMQGIYASSGGGGILKKKG
ncbi:MAG TPA: PilT/PilU family type 4a pilus ATPase [Candidatus Hydrogenedentes bacterium]|nr:PilT/PilU family type 4a pilus ATPase [Candidatus Hydrogenedentota bacterium]HQE83726.1 PilT/PilU family type 4a pilus ATPase [Candidatus Hydrogenedentota bacterium]HQH52868.1 PilT/PilU family type 4a pilus ATPase [Candidatus Hydrogenedentota bacterium]HQM47352.1 PilT/PilU family type 4a pilus ATPase [Candidatus Hydrogenedentota bacterium]